jgi:hypothetical protein
MIPMSAHPMEHVCQKIIVIANQDTMEALARIGIAMVLFSILHWYVLD